MISPTKRRSFIAGLAILAVSVASTKPAIAGDDEAFRPVSFPSVSLAKAKTFSADFYVDDRDRDPWGIDVFDVGFRFRYQAGENTELFGNDALALFLNAAHVSMSSSRES